MRSALFGLCICACAGAQQPPAAEASAFVELTAARETYFVREPIRVVLRVGFDGEFFRTNAIQATRQQLDIPVQVEANFLRELPGAILIDDVAGGPRDGGPRKSFSLNDGLVEGRQVADRTISGRQFTAVEVTKRVSADRPGQLVVPGPRLRFSYAARFEEDLVNGRVPVDRREAVIQAKDLTLTIHPLPEDGRPPGFTGAVGRFSIRAEANRRELRAGESLRLTLTIEGDGNLESFDPPRLESLPGLRNLGVIDHKTPSLRVLTYDLAPVNEDVKEVPPIPFSFFEPEPRPRYRVVRTAPIPITVRPSLASAPVDRVPEDAGTHKIPGENDIFDLKVVGVPRAEDAYRAGRYAEADELFRRVLAEPGVPQGRLLYDLGNCAYRLGRHAEAMLHYRRAQLRLPRDDEVRSNLRLAERELGTPGRSRTLLESFTAGELATLAALLLALGFPGFFMRRHGARLAAVVLTVLGVSVGARAAQVRWFPGAREGVVLGNEIALRGDPHPEIAASLRLRAGEIVRISEMTDRWVHVVHTRGEGWTERAGIGIVD